MLLVAKIQICTNCTYCLYLKDMDTVALNIIIVNLLPKCKNKQRSLKIYLYFVGLKCV